MRHIFIGVALMFAVAVPAFFLADLSGKLPELQPPISFVSFATGMVYIIVARRRRRKNGRI